ncbi:MAG: LppA family lipoprotein, partial [Dermatophilaceae bacterium]
HGIHAHTRLHRHQHDRRGSRAVTVLLTTALALLLLAITGGCTTEDHTPTGLPPTTDTGATMKARAELMSRPSFEQAEKTYLNLLTRVRAVIDQRAPHLQWAQPAPSRADLGTCGAPFEMILDAETGIYDAGGRGATGAIDDATWPGLLDAIRAVAKEDGFTRLVVIRDSPGAHNIELGDPRTGARITIGTEVGTSLALYGACFLPDAARQSHTPT